MAVRTPKWIALALGLSLTVALLALAACGGGDSTNASTTATTSGRATATQKPNQNATKTEQATDTPAGTSSSDVLSQLQALGGDVKQAKGKITYAETDTTGATTFITYYSAPPNARYDTTESDGSSSAYIETPATTYICTSSDQTCIATAGTGTGSAGLGLLSGFFNSSSIDAIVAAAQAQGIPFTKSNENIAGTDATCFSGTTNGEGEKFCFSDNGVLLAEQTIKADGTTSGLTATAYSSDVSDSDFQPPYPVTTFPAIPTG